MANNLATRKPPKIALLMVLAVTLVFCLVFLEVAIRLAVPQHPSWLDIYREHPDLPFYGLEVNLERFTDIGETSYAVHTDANGFRVAKSGPPDSSLPEVLVIGDSFAFGHGVDYEDSFVGQLNEDSAYRFVNAGVGGYGPVQYEAVLKYLLEKKGHQPKAIIAATFLGNDFHDCVWEKNHRVVDGIIGGEVSFRSFVKRNSHLYRLLAKIYHRFGPASGNHGKPDELYMAANWADGIGAETLPIYQESFRKIAELARGQNAPLLVVIIPLKQMVAFAKAEEDVRSSLPEGADPLLPDAKARAVFEELSIPYVDTLEALTVAGSKVNYLRFDGHLTRAGNEVVTAAIREKLKTLMAAPAAQAE